MSVQSASPGTWASSGTCLAQATGSGLGWARVRMAAGGGSATAAAGALAAAVAIGAGAASGGALWACAATRTPPATSSVTRINGEVRAGRLTAASVREKSLKPAALSDDHWVI